MSDKLSIVQHEENAGYAPEEPPPYTTVVGHASDGQDEKTEIKVYSRRWYILGLFCLLACHQCVVWNTWGPIESGTQFAFTWPDSTVPMFANWGTIMFVISAVPLTKLVEVDIRRTVLLVSGLVLVGTAVRCCRLIPNLHPTIFLYSCHLCAILNGISGVTIMAAPPLISSAWFPASERTTATAINQASNMLGNGVSMLVGPYLVHYTPAKNATSFNLYSNSSSGQTPEDVEKSIDTYMQILAAVSVALFCLFLIYFPSKPPNPPAPSSAKERTEFISGIKALLTNRDVLLSCFAYSISQGVMGSWLGVMVNQIKPLGYDDQDIGLMGLASVVSQCLMSVLFGYISDRLKHKKLTILCLLSVSACGFTWLMLMCTGTVSHSKYTLYLAIIIATSVSFSCCPLFFEMTVELAYPVNEGAVGGFLTAVYNFVGIVFLFLFFVPSLTSGNYIWISYTLVGSTIIAIPVTAFVQEKYNRSNADNLS